MANVRKWRSDVCKVRTRQSTTDEDYNGASTDFEQKRHNGAHVISRRNADGAHLAQGLAEIRVQDRSSGSHVGHFAERNEIMTPKCSVASCLICCDGNNVCKYSGEARDPHGKVHQS